MSTVSELLYMRLCSNMDFDPITHDEVLAIIAVVEAAENCPCSDYGTLREQCPQCVALAALAAKLEQQ